ncbi:MAG TPA: peptide-methionine (S)-S-oxide reductase MsrA [Caldimonas sp.]|nr:peptide-methionine (S)-S-oxide reductase MsrA [Caldimonas sp.]
MTTKSSLPRVRRAATTLAGWAAALALGASALQLTNSAAAEAPVKIPAAAADETASASGTQTAVFAGGCFWGVQGVFQRVNGVVQAVSGYAGGKKETAHYEMVGTGLTGHAESVKITYDPKKVSYATLLQIYFSVVHDPTELNRQGPDSGTQYRSAVFYADAAQKQTAERYIAQLDAAKVFPSKIVTQVVPLTEFYAAEGYHQDYLTLHPESGYIARFDLPKVASLKSLFPQQYRAEPALVTARAQASK